jgi:hypothetical protein
VIAHQGRFKRLIGGVSPHRITPAPAATGAEHSPDFKYNGGPVIRCPQVYGAFWGPQWANSGYATQPGLLMQFIKDLLGSRYMNVLSQYGVGFGAGAAGSYIKSTFVANVPAQLTGPTIHQLIQDCINAGVLPEPPATKSNICLMIFLDDTLTVEDSGIAMCQADGDNAFGYHSDFTTTAGHEFYFAVIPALTDACARASCGAEPCSLSLTQPQEQRITQVTSHGFCEMVTDPKFTTGWYGSVSGENGDICNGQTATITVGANTWAVQRQYSKAGDLANGGGAWSVVDAADPIPELAGGPASGVIGIARLQQLQALYPLLPLPATHYDSESKQTTMEQAAIEDYARRLFNPFDHTNLVPGLPQMLRRLADHFDNK